MNEHRIINPHEAKPESDYLELERLSIKLGIPVPQVHLSVEVTKDGRIISSHRQRSRTTNRNYWNALLCMVTDTPGVVTDFGAGYLSFKQVNATVQAVTKAQQTWNGVGAINNSIYGILLGIGTGAESFEGNALGTICANGTAANQLVYSAHSALAQSYNAGTKVWTITIKRICNNNSAADIVVAETGLVWQNTSLGIYVMFCRDLLASTQNVAVGAQVTVQYGVTLTFPA
ncbi:hypothetical protein D4R89_12950 [bacterium]|nr:MAG: hypothetical protein D4R89_12950 [bacterium]